MATIYPEELRRVLLAVFQGIGIPETKAALCADVVTESTVDGVLSHGAAMVPGFVRRVKQGDIDVHADPVQLGQSGATEQWDGRSALGICNATACTARAMEIARQFGIGCVGLRNTNHWFRAGTYGWQAVREGMAMVCWTNTVPNMPAWGARSRSVGNNPLVIALPHPDTPLVLDIAMSQVSMGKLRQCADSGTPLPVPGGYDAEDALTCDPVAIMDGGRALPMGFWKGSGLALCLDLLAVMLAGGNGTAHLARMDAEHDVSQVFIAFRNPSQTEGFWEKAVTETLRLVHSAEPVTSGQPARAPGEGTLARRERQQKQGLDLEDDLWQAIQELFPTGDG